MAGTEPRAYNLEIILDYRTIISNNCITPRTIHDLLFAHSSIPMWLSSLRTEANMGTRFPGADVRRVAKRAGKRRLRCQLPGRCLKLLHSLHAVAPYFFVFGYAWLNYLICPQMDLFI